MTSSDEDAFVQRLLEALPVLRPRYSTVAAELRDLGHEDQVASELIREYSRDLLDRFRHDTEAVRVPLLELAAFLEGEFGRSVGVDSEIKGGFLDFVPLEAEPDPADLLGPKQRAYVEKERQWRAAPAEMALVRRLLEAVPDLAELAEDNEYGRHRDVLVHRFLADVAFRQADNVVAGRLREVRAVLDVLESAYGTGDVDEPIAVSFVEDLPYPGEPGVEIVNLLGPKLRAELELQRPGMYGG